MKWLLFQLNISQKNGDRTSFVSDLFGGTTAGERSECALYSSSSTRAKSSCIFYLPQSPYICTGSLLDNVFYPLSTRPADPLARHRIESLFRQVGLAPLLPRLCAMDTDWSSTLSGGERQKLSFVRLLFHQPPFAALDEATSALSTDAQALLYGLLQKSGVTYLSIAHRSEVKKYHTRELKIIGDQEGGWKLEDIGERVIL